MQYVQHVVVVSILVLVYLKHLLRVALHLSLVEHAEHLFQPVVHIAMQKRNLNDDAVVGETLYERLFAAFLHNVAVIVEHVVIYVHYRFFDVPYLMSKEIYSHHRIGKAFLVFFAYIVLVAVLRSKILTETECFGIEPRLLQFNQHHAVLLHIAFALTNGSSKVNAEHRERVACGVAVFMRTYRHVHHFFLQQSRQHGLGYALVLHDVFEHGVVNRVGYMYKHKVLVLLFLQK